MASKQSTLPEECIEQADALLRRTGLRVTQARRWVLAALLASDEALSHNELQAALPEIDRVTLYRTLDALVEAQLAHRIALNDRAFRYGAGPGNPASDNLHHRHGHFKCTGCGKVFCLPQTNRRRSMLEQLQKAVTQAMEPGFQTHDIELTVKGWCADCAH